MSIQPALAHLSDTLFTTAIATYTLATVGYIGEYAFGRRGRIAETAAVVRTDAVERQRELVGAGGLAASRPPAGPPAAPPAAARRRPLADRVGRFAVVVTVLGVLLHLTSVAVRAVAVDEVPWSDMYEFASVAGLVGVVAFLGVLWKAPQIRHLGGFVLAPTVGLMFFAGTVWYSRAQPLVPALQSYWLAIHVFLVALAEGALATSAVFSGLYLVKVRTARAAARPGYRPGSIGVLATRLPDSATLDKVAYRIVVFAFPLYTIGIVCGAIWAEAAWGRYWGWDPKETWAFIVWVIYAGYLHARATAGWKGRVPAWVNLAGFAAINVNLIVVNVVISGLHSYAGLS